MIIAGTGPRRFIANGVIAAALHAAVAEDSNAYPDLRLMSGGAEGWDHAIYLVAALLDLPLTLALPNPGYGDYYWRKNSVTGNDRYSEFQNMVDYATSNGEVVYVCHGLYENGLHANFVRNQWMADHGNKFYVHEPTSRGTSDCVRRIKKANKPYKVFM